MREANSRREKLGKNTTGLVSLTTTNKIIAFLDLVEDNILNCSRTETYLGFGGKFCDMTMLESFSSLLFWLPEMRDCRLANSTNGGHLNLLSDWPHICGLFSSSQIIDPRLTGDDG
jgi:hypothetical protein